MQNTEDKKEKTVLKERKGEKKERKEQTDHYSQKNVKELST